MTNHLKNILQYTTMRRYHVGGRVGREGLVEPAGAKEREDKNNRLIEVFRGIDVRCGRLAHLERGCCTSDQETRNKTFAAITEGDLLLCEHHQLPSKHRIGSMTSSNADQVAGYMICDILGTCLRGVFQATPDGDLDVDGQAYEMLVRSGTRTVCCICRQ